MLTKAAIDKISSIMQKDVTRALKMRVPGFPRPYYCSFLLHDLHWFNTWAASGSTYRRRSDRSRHVYCDMRVGSYRSDQVANGGLNDNDDELESTAHVDVPIDDRDYHGLRIGLWRLSEAKFREALLDYTHKEGYRVAAVDPTSNFRSFCRLKHLRSVSYRKREFVDEDKWVRFCKLASNWMSQLPNLTASWVDFDVSQETKIFVNTEKRVIVQHKQIYALTATFRKLTTEGAQLDQELVFNCCNLRELPNWRMFKALALIKYEKLQRLIKAKRIHSFTGPVLLHPIPAGLLLHEAIGHRLEGSRLLANGEGQTFKGQLGKKILGLDLTIHDNPKLKKFNGASCIGSYDYDDEGTPAQDAILIKDAKLRGFLTTRAAISKRGSKSNGHARNKKFQRPISRMAVTIIEGKHPVSMEALKEQLIAEIIKQKKSFGMIIYDTSGGETDTTSYDFQAFAGEIAYATLIDCKGRETPIRGVDFVGTPLQALNNIIAIGDELELDNGYCGAESGMLPISTISPAILISNLELQAKDEELVTQYILPKPRLRK